MLIGPDEREQGRVLVRELDTGAEELVPREEITERLAGQMSG